jgi:hypothetical protein
MSKRVLKKEKRSETIRELFSEYFENVKPLSSSFIFQLKYSIKKKGGYTRIFFNSSNNMPENNLLLLSSS